MLFVKKKTGIESFKFNTDIFLQINVGFLGIPGNVRVSKQDKQTYTSEFEFQWVPHSFGLMPHRSKKLPKLLNVGFLYREVSKSASMHNSKQYDEVVNFVLLLLLTLHKNNN